MRDHRMERFVILPFSVGCISESSVAVARQHPRRSKPATRTRHEEEDEESLSNESMKPDISTGFHKVFKTFKTFSQLFVYKDEMEDSDEDMEIGVPTDVKHVAHVGLDESDSSSPSMSSWDNLFSPQHLFTLPSDPAGECELPMEPLVQASTSRKGLGI